MNAPDDLILQGAHDLEIQRLFGLTAGRDARRLRRLAYQDQEGGLEGTLKVTYTGLRALTQRNEQRNQDAASRKTSTTGPTAPAPGEFRSWS